MINALFIVIIKMVYIQFSNKITREIISEDEIKRDILKYINSFPSTEEDPELTQSQVDKYLFPSIWMNGVVLNKQFRSDNFSKEQVESFMLNNNEDLNCRHIKTMIYILTKYMFHSSNSW
jgi:hypothetical protein